MKILLLDIETAPNLAYVWGLWDQNIIIDNIVESGYTMCWAAKWLGEPAKNMHFESILGQSRAEMLIPIYDLLDEADVVVHYNGKKFDMPNLNKEFVKQEWTPPSPYKQLDLLSTVRRQFKFPSNKLDFVCRELGLGQKHHHKGMKLWHECMAGDEKAWKTMKTYNKQDVVLLEQLYNRLLPWIDDHPNRSTSGEINCPICGSYDFQHRGPYHAKTRSYQRYRCVKGHWFKGDIIKGTRKIATPLAIN